MAGAVAARDRSRRAVHATPLGRVVPIDAEN